MSEKVFVYGTLRRGDGRFGVRSFVKIIEEEAWINGFDMLDLGGFPGLVLSPERADADPYIRGEVHEYEDLRTLDSIEGYNSRNPSGGLYNRTQVTAYTKDGSVENCWVYVFNGAPREASEIIQSGDWFEHRGLYSEADTI